MMFQLFFRTSRFTIEPLFDLRNLVLVFDGSLRESNCHSKNLDEKMHIVKVLIGECKSIS